MSIDKSVDKVNNTWYNKYNKRDKQRRLMTMTIRHFLANLVVLANMAFMVWVGASFIDVVVDNSTTAEHASWNAFVILTELAE